MTIQEFIQKYGITISSVRLPERMDGEQSDWDKNAFHYLATIKRHEVSAEGVVQTHRLLAAMSTPYSKGSGHIDKKHGMPIPPKADEVLDCLARDSQGDLSNFEDWAFEYGYDTDSRRAEAIFKACQSQTIRFKKFLGAEAYRELIENVERF